MLPDALPQLIETLLRLPDLEAAQLRELIQHLPDPQALAQEMVRRGWLTQDQFSSLFPGPQQRPTPQETMLVGFGDDESPPDADDDDWGLTISDEEDQADVPPDVEWAQPDRTEEAMRPEPDGDDWGLALSDEEDKADVPPDVEWAQPDRTEEAMRPEPETVEAVPVFSGAASSPPFEWAVPVPPVAGGNEARRRESDTDKPPRQWMGCASIGLLMGTLILGSLFAWVQFFEANSTVLTDQRGVTRPQITAAKADTVPNNKAAAGNPAGAVDLPPVRPIVPINNAEQSDDLLNGTGQDAQPAAPVPAKPAPRPPQPVAPVPAKPAPRPPQPQRAPYTIEMTVGDRTVTRTVQLDENGAVVPDAGPVADPQAVLQSLPMSPDPQQAEFSQWVNQHILKAQKQAMETAEQNMQRSQQFQQKVRQEIFQMQQQIWQRHQAIIQRSQQLNMRLQR